MGLSETGELGRRLRSGDDEDLRKLARVLQRLRPDLILLNEFDYDPDVDAAALLNQRYLSHAGDGLAPIEYPHAFTAPVNTGVDSGLDLNGDGALHGPGDAWGFGRFPGQYGMLVLSRFPVDRDAVRTFRLLPWSALPGAARPRWPDGRPFYDDGVWSAMRLSSKSHWDLPIDVSPDTRLHLLASHPTPPVFDGPEDRNGARNRDEIRFWVDYIEPGRGDWIRDDAGDSSGLPDGAAWVMVGDLNADPADGDSRPGGIDRLLSSGMVNDDCVPASPGGAEATVRQGGANTRHRGDPARDTADFDDRNAGNLRADYVLTGVDTRVADCGVFWPAPGEPGHDWIGFTDHRLVWMDIVP